MLTYKRVFFWLCVFAFAREIASALRWALPQTIDLGTQPAVEALVSRLVAVAITAALVYLALRGVGAARERWIKRGRER